MTVKPLKVVIGSLVKDDFAAIQRKPKAQARAELQQLKERVQRLEITSRMYTGKKARTRSGREGVELRAIQKQIKSTDLQEIIETQDDYECAGKIDTLAGKILGGQAPLGLREKIQTIPLEKTVQRTLDLFNEGAAALEALIENPDNAAAKAALERANQELQAMLPKEEPGFLSRLSGAASSVVTNVTQRLRTLEMRRIARDYGVPIVLGAVSHMTEHPEMFTTYAGLYIAANFVRSCRRPQAPKQLGAPESPSNPAAATVQTDASPALVTAAQEEAPATVPSSAPSDLAQEQIADAAAQDKDLPPAPSNTPEPVVAATDSGTQVASLKPEAPARTSPPAALPLTSAPSEAALGDQAPPVGEMTHHMKPKIKAPGRRAAKVVPFIKDAPQQLAKPKPQARTPSPVAPSLSPVPAAGTASQTSLLSVGNPRSAFKPLGKPPALGFALSLATQAAAKAAQLKKPAVVAASHTAPAHMSALQAPKKAVVLPYYVTTGDASQFHLGAKYACNFITGYLQIRMHEAAKEKRSLTSDDLNYVMMQGASSYEGCLKHYNEETGSEGHHAFTWEECLARDKYLSSQIRPAREYATVVAAPKATFWGTFPPISDGDFNNIFGEMIEAADVAPGTLIIGTVTFGSDAGVAESFPVGIRKVVGGYEYIFGNSHGTDIGSDSIQVNRFNPVVQNYKTHFQRYLAQRLSVVKSSPQGTIGVEVSINQVRV